MVSATRSDAASRWPGRASISRSSLGNSAFSPCDQTFGFVFSSGRAVANSSASSAATTTCFGVTMSMQWASAVPTSWVLISAATPPALVMPIQAAMYSGRFGIRRQTVSPLARFSRSAQRA